MHFLSVGECMAELSPGEGPGDYRLGFAGDTFNTAWYLSRLRPKDNVSFFTAVGTDSISAQMRASFRASGIDDGHVQIVPDRTVGLYMISLANGERSFSYWRHQSAARKLADDAEALKAAMQEANVVYYSGITLAILDEPARKTLLASLRIAREAGKTVAFDPNLRPRLWANPDEMTATIMQGAAVSDITLPSFEDEAVWFGDPDPKATIERYAAAGVTTVVVKNGAGAVHYRNGTDRGTVPVAKLPFVVDTTAAGDSFNAGFLAGLQSDKPLPESIAKACQLAAKVVQGKGALVQVDPSRLD